MTVKKETKNINGIDYLCIQWDADQAYLMKFKLGKVLGGAFEKLASAITGDEGIQAKAIGAAFNEMFKTNEPEDILSILKEVVCSAIKDGERLKQSTFAQDFAGNLKTPYLIFAFVLKVNYSDFLGESVDVSKLLEKVGL